VRVLKADGTIEHRRVRWISKSFFVNGVEYSFAKPDDKRPCHACEGWHSMDEVRNLYGGGTMHTGAVWRKGQSWCSCGGFLAEETT